MPCSLKKSRLYNKNLNFFRSSRNCVKSYRADPDLFSLVSLNHTLNELSVITLENTHFVDLDLALFLTNYSHLIPKITSFLSCHFFKIQATQKIMLNVDTKKNKEKDSYNRFM